MIFTTLQERVCIKKRVSLRFSFHKSKGTKTPSSCQTYLLSSPRSRPRSETYNRNGDGWYDWTSFNEWIELESKKKKFYPYYYHGWSIPTTIVSQIIYVSCVLLRSVFVTYSLYSESVE